MTVETEAEIESTDRVSAIESRLRDHTERSHRENG